MLVKMNLKYQQGTRHMAPWGFLLSSTIFVTLSSRYQSKSATRGMSKLELRSASPRSMKCWSKGISSTNKGLERWRLGDFFSSVSFQHYHQDISVLGISKLEPISTSPTNSELEMLVKRNLKLQQVLGEIINTLDTKIDTKMTIIRGHP